jgi:hypothetical protein
MHRVGEEGTVMSTNAFFTPLAVLVFAAATGCGGAAPGEEGAPSGGTGAESTTPENARPADQGTPGTPSENVGKTQQPWLVPGFGFGYAPFSGYGGFGYPYGYGLGYGIGTGYSVSCINGFCY